MDTGAYSVLPTPYQVEGYVFVCWCIVRLYVAVCDACECVCEDVCAFLACCCCPHLLLS